MNPTTAEILIENNRLIQAAPLMSLAYVVFSTAANTMSDQPGWESFGVFASTAVSLALGYLLVAKMVENGGLADRKRAGFWRYFGLGILSTLGIGLGLVFLIVPGIFLLVRWSAAYGVMFAEGRGVGDSLKESFDLTEGSSWPLFAALLIPVVLSVGSMVVVGVWFGVSGEVSLGASFAANAAISIAGLYMTGIGLGFYSLRKGRAQEFDEVFA